jgi:hypothetical protein
MAESKPVYCQECNYSVGSYALDKRGRYVRQTHANSTGFLKPPLPTWIATNPGTPRARMCWNAQH